MATSERMKISKYMYEKNASTAYRAIYGWRQQTNMIHDRNVRGPKNERDIMEEEKFEWLQV